MILHIRKQLHSKQESHQTNKTKKQRNSILQTHTYSGENFLQEKPPAVGMELD